MPSPSDTPGRSSEDRVVAVVFSAILILGGAWLIAKGIRGLEDGVARVTGGSIKAGPLSPVQAIVGGALLSLLGFYFAGLALRKKKGSEQ